MATINIEMVISKIDKTIHYVENRKIDQEDRGYAASLFSIEIHGKDIVIGLGKEKHTYDSKNIVFFPIYLFADNLIKSQIGVYEMMANDVIANIDDDGDMNIEELEPLLFSFVTPKFLEKSGSSPEFYYAIKKETDETGKSKGSNETYIEKSKDSKETKDDIRQISTKMKVENYNPNAAAKNTFEIDSNKNMPDLLPEESESDADELVKQYISAPSHNWIKKFMENGEYEIVSNECSSVDSFYCMIRDAFSQIGHKTTVALLRDLVSKEITDEYYENCLDHYLTYSSEIADIDREMRDIKKTVSIFKTRIEKSVNKDEQKNIIKSAEEQKEKYKNLAVTKKTADTYVAEYAFMKSVKSVEDLRQLIKNPSSIEKLHEFAVSAIEKELNIKIIGLLQDAYEQGDLNAVVECHGDKQTHANPRPKYYIIMTHSMKNKQCELVSYKNKRIFVFGELPYHIKTLIVNKCAENNGGTFSSLSDFRNFQNKLGVKFSSEEDDDWIKSDLYDPLDVFIFHAKSMNSSPGKLKGEKLDKSHLTEYRNLELAKGWRRMLDDRYEMPFKLDKMRWQTVEHYYQASKFKKRNPDFYKIFSLDSNSEISTNLMKAIEAGNNKGKGRPKNIVIDPDFYGLDGGRAVEERRLAVSAKFNQNEDLRRVLLNTKKAILKQHIKGELPVPDMILMEVRKKV